MSGGSSDSDGRAIVTVRHRDEPIGRDLEVPVDVGALELGLMIARALRWQTDGASSAIAYRIAADPPGRVLEADESLAEAGAWDGTHLVLEPFDSPVRATPAPPEQTQATPSSSESPLTGWRPLKLNEQLSQPARPAAESGGDGYIMKRLDD